MGYENLSQNLWKNQRLGHAKNLKRESTFSSSALPVYNDQSLIIIIIIIIIIMVFIESKDKNTYLMLQAMKSSKSI